MKKFNKVISMVLLIAMIFTSTPLTGWADVRQERDMKTKETETTKENSEVPDIPDIPDIPGEDGDNPSGGEENKPNEVKMSFVDKENKPIYLNKQNDDEENPKQEDMELALPGTPLAYDNEDSAKKIKFNDINENSSKLPNTTIKSKVDGKDYKYSLEKVVFTFKDDRTVTKNTGNYGFNFVDGGESNVFLGNIFMTEEINDNTEEDSKPDSRNAQTRYILDFTNIKSIKAVYKKVEEIQLELKFNYKDIYHKGDKDEEDFKNLGTRKINIPLELENENAVDLKLEYKSSDNKIHYCVDGNKGSFIPNSNYKVESMKETSKGQTRAESNNITITRHIGYDDLSKPIDFDLSLKPREVDNYGRLNLKNRYNEKLFSKYLFIFHKGKLSLNTRVSSDKRIIDVSDIISLKFNNRNETNKLEDDKFYYNDNLTYDLKEGKTFDNIIKKVVGDNYKADITTLNNGRFPFNVGPEKVNANEDYEYIYFDYARNELTINHKGTGENAEVKSTTISLMPDTEYLYLKPQGEGGSITTGKAITGPDIKGYYKIDISKLGDNKAIDINYKGEAPAIETTDYKVKNYVIKASGSTTNLYSSRDFTGYVGSMFSVSPIKHHDYKDGEEINISGNRLADRMYKFIELNDNGPKILGYGKELDDLSKNNIPGDDDIEPGNDIKKPAVRFRFVGDDSVYYRIIHRTATNKGKNNDGDKYDLSLESLNEGNDEVKVIYQSKQYVVPKGEELYFEPIKGQELIKSKNVEKNRDPDYKPKEVRERKSEKGGPDIAFMWKDGFVKLENDTKIVFSYANQFNVVDKSNKEAKLEIKFERLDTASETQSDESSSSGPKDFMLEYPRLKDNYTVYMPVDIFSCYNIKDMVKEIDDQAYKKAGFESIEYINTNNNATEDTSDGDMLKLVIAHDPALKKGIVDYFPKATQLLARSLMNGKEDSSNLPEISEDKAPTIIFKYTEKDQCTPENRSLQEINLIPRVNDNGTYEVDPKLGQTIKTFSGSFIEIDKKYEKLPTFSLDYEYPYVDYEANKNNTGITDKDGKHIKTPKVDFVNGIPKANFNDKIDMDIGDWIYVENKASENNNLPTSNIYLNYNQDEIKYPDLEDLDSSNKYKKEVYYIPFSYFDEDIKENIEDMSGFKEFKSEVSTKECKPDRLIPGKTDSYKEKYNALLEMHRIYYTNKDGGLTKNELENYLNAKLKNTGLTLVDWESFTKDDSNYGEKAYIDFLAAKLPNEDASESKTSEDNDDSSDSSAIETLISKLQADYNLVDYLEAMEVPVKSSKNTTQLETHSDTLKIRSNDSSLKKNLNNLFHKQTDLKSYNDTIANEKVVETIYTTTRYSNLPFSISNKRIEGGFDFIEDPARKLQDDNFTEIDVKENYEDDNRIPIIFLERQNTCKSITRTPIPPNPGEDPGDDNEKGKTSLRVEYVVSRKNGEDLENPKPFKTFEMKNLPFYMIDSQVGWEVTNFESQGFKYIGDGKTQNGKTIQWSPKLEDGKEAVMQVEYDNINEGDDNTPPSLETSTLTVNGYDSTNDKKIYSYSSEGPVDSERLVYPYNIENQGLYLLDRDNNISFDYEKQAENIRFTKDDQVFNYYYRELNDNEADMTYKVEYLDDSGKEIAKADSFRGIVKLKENFDREAKDIAGYDKRIDSKTFVIDKRNNKNVIKFAPLTEAEEKDGYSIEGNTLYRKTKDNKTEKVIEIGDNIIKFYYGKDNNSVYPPLFPLNFTFDANGGEIDGRDKLTVKVISGKLVEENKTAKKDGFRLLGWTLDKDGEDLFDFKKPITKNTTVYAKWVEKPMLNRGDHMEYIGGYPDGTIRGSNNISREEVAAIFYRLLDSEYRESIKTSDYKFNDQIFNWSKTYVASLANGGILEGYPDGNFRPRNNITRAEVAVIASRFEDLEDSDHNFTDVKGHWAEEYIGSAAKKGWIEGYPDGSFRPSQDITRGEFVTLVNRVLERGIKEENLLNGIKKFKDLNPKQWYYYELVEAINGHMFEREEGAPRRDEVWTELKEFDSLEIE